MQSLYIDESGSMTTQYSNDFPYFIICVIRVFNFNALRRHFKWFISKNFKLLKSIDKKKQMFDGDKFKELKGSALTTPVKIKLANYLLEKCNSFFEINIIQINNVEVNPITYDNTARAFNYFMNLFMTNRLHKKAFPCDDYYLHIDERNTKPDAKRSLEDYLATDLILNKQLIKSVKVDYINSCEATLIQLSDFFANLYYSYLRHNKDYNEIIHKLKENKLLKYEFVFPSKNNMQQK